MNDLSIFELLLTAVALSMDAMAVAISSGILARSVRLKDAMLMALFFGFFQFLMPVIGYYIIPLLGSIFGEGVVDFVRSADHFIAFGLLAFIGGKMVFEAIQNKDEDGANSFKFKTLLIMAVATSIDALAVGITYNTLSLTFGFFWFAVIAIGVITFGLSLLGVLLGKKLGSKFKRWAVLGGGIVLIGIGIKILIEHIFFQ